MSKPSEYRYTERGGVILRHIFGVTLDIYSEKESRWKPYDVDSNVREFFEGVPLTAEQVRERLGEAALTQGEN